ncbi:MAG: hypothetical protein HOW97_12195 [Catenulispora sp.]|nr:hypothetical protein [Catenulispora sp.]
MSTNSTRTEYTFQWFVYSEGANFVIGSDVGMTDEMAFALNNAFKNLGWSDLGNLTATVAKRTVSEVDFTADETTTPPSFT